MSIISTEFVIVGAGIIGLTVAREIKLKHPSSKILVIDKEADVANHASGRNSGVLHAGLYYSSDSNKAKFCRLGSILMLDYCRLHGIPINQCGKVIVAHDDEDIIQLHALRQKAIKNNVEVTLLSEAELAEIEPNANTYKHALYSPNTASYDPKQICQTLKNELLQLGVDIIFHCKYLGIANASTIKTSRALITYRKLINCAGIYSDKLSKDFDLLGNYMLIPFKGIFLHAKDAKGTLKRHIYKVPDKKHNLLGVHFSPNVTGDDIKVGPTAMPCLSRENYKWCSNLRFSEVKESLMSQFKLAIKNDNSFRQLALQELRKQTKKGLINNSRRLVKNIHQFHFYKWGVSGIQAKLYDSVNHKIADDYQTSINFAGWRQLRLPV